MRTDMDVTEMAVAFRNRFANASTTVRVTAIRNLPIRSSSDGDTQLWNYEASKTEIKQ